MSKRSEHTRGKIGSPQIQHLSFFVVDHRIHLRSETMKRNILFVLLIGLIVVTITNCCSDTANENHDLIIDLNQVGMIPDSPISEGSRFDAALFFPLNPGDTFTYRETKPDGIVTVIKQVDVPIMPPRHTTAVTPITEIADGEVAEIAYFTSDSSTGLLNYGEDDIEGGCKERLSPAFAIPHDLVVGETVTSTLELNITGEDCDNATAAVYKVTFQSIESVTVPVGTFDGCAKIQIRESWKDANGDTISEGTKTLFLAQDVGMIKEIDAEDGEEEVAELIAFSNAGYEPHNPAINPANFTTDIDNPYFPLKPGTVWTYEGETEDGLESIAVEVTDQTREVAEVTCVVVRDTVRLDGEVLEDTYDWYAQDNNGNVWYMGEDTKEYEDGVVVSTEGSWEAGVDGAMPGIVMEAKPKIGDSYRQEYYRGEAEDLAGVISLNESVEVPLGSYENCLKTREWTPIEPDVLEYKYYAPGVGMVMEVDVKTGEGAKLVKIAYQ